MYEKYRPTYPQLLFDTIYKILTPPFLKAIDLGAGTGISTKFLSDRFKIVYAVEPDVQMIKAGCFSKNVNIINSTSEKAVFPKESVSLIISGNSFYWMNAEIVLENIYHWLEYHGEFATFRYDFPQLQCQHANSILSNESQNNWNSFRSNQLRDTDYSIRKITDFNKFKNVSVQTIPYILKWNLDELMGFLLSTSYVNAFLKANSAPDTYITNLIQKFLDLEIEWPINVDMSLELITAVK